MRIEFSDHFRSEYALCPHRRPGVSFTQTYISSLVPESGEDFGFDFGSGATKSEAREFFELFAQFWGTFASVLSVEVEWTGGFAVYQDLGYGIAIFDTD